MACCNGAFRVKGGLPAHVVTDQLPLVIVITDFQLGPKLWDGLEAALEVDARLAVQLRHPRADGRTLFEAARRLQVLCAKRGNALFINGRLDVALAVGAHLHLPSHGFSVTD